MSAAAYRRALRLSDAAPTLLQEVRWPAAEAAGVRLLLKRDDLLDPEISGNKWRKLLPQVTWALRGGARGFASVGGWHSNHLSALAALGHRLGVPTLGFVRGWDGVTDSPTTAFAKTRGMVLRPVTRAQLRAWRAGEVPSEAELGGLTWVPEGGSSRLGLLGVRQTVREVEQVLAKAPSAYWVAVGSGGTAAGLARGTAATVRGVTCARDAGLPQRIRALATGRGRPVELHDGALGGFASGEVAIWEVMQAFHDLNGVWLDPIYTAKVLLHLTHFLRADKSGTSRGETQVLVHTGGLQGLPAWRRRYAY